MSLVWNGTTITDWFHCAGRTTRGPANKNVAFAKCRGREIVNLGGSIDNQSSKMIYFATEGDYRNVIKETARATVLSKIASVMADYEDGESGTLTFSGETHSDMLLVDFQLLGDIQTRVVGGTTYYLQYFTATFAEEYDG